MPTPMSIPTAITAYCGDVRLIGKRSRTEATEIPAIAPTLSFLLDPLPVDVIVLANVVENAAVVVDAAVAASVVVAPRVVETNVDIVAVSRGEYIAQFA